MTSSRRIASTVTMIVGLFFIAITFGLSLFTRTSDAQKLNDYYRPLMSDKGLAQFATNLQIVDGAAAELPKVVVPKLATDLGMTDAQFTTYVQTHDPHVANFIIGTGKLLPVLNPATQAVLARKADFKDADRFPVANVPLNWGPYVLVAGGLVLIGVGWFMRRDRRSLSLYAAGAAAVVMIGAPIALGWFHETAAAERVAEAARAPFSAAVGNTVVDNIYGIDAAFVEMRQSLFPAVADQLGLDARQMNATLHQEFPATMRMLDEWDTQLHEIARVTALSQIRYSDEFHNADATPYRALPWIVILPGVVLLIGVAIGLRPKRSAAAQVDARDVPGDDRVPAMAETA